MHLAYVSVTAAGTAGSGRMTAAAALSFARERP